MSDEQWSNSSIDGESDFILMDLADDDPLEADPNPVRHNRDVVVDDEPQESQDFRCLCGHCAPEEPDEYLCCSSVSRVASVLNEASVECITQHPLFPDLCTRRELLVVHGRAYRRHYRVLRDLDPNDNRCIRYAAYACFVHWVWGYLGPNNRRQIPGCVVRTVRSLFPSNTYTGYFA